MAIEHLQNDVEAATLLPGGREVPALVLFWRNGDAASGNLLDHLSSRAVESPVYALDVESTPQTAEWFGIRQVPSLVVVLHGAIYEVIEDVGVEYDTAFEKAVARMKWLHKQDL